VTKIIRYTRHGEMESFEVNTLSFVAITTQDANGFSVGLFSQDYRDRGGFITHAPFQGKLEIHHPEAL
jgi:hypothetical protein